MIYEILLNAILLLLHCVVILSSTYGNDLSINKYTNTGEIAQVIYASRYIDKSIPTFAFTFNNNSKLISISFRYPGSPLQLTNIEHIDLFGNGEIALVSIGYDPDIKSLKSYANLITQSHILIYGEIPSIDYYSKKISMWLTRGLYPADDENNFLSRPMAASALLLTFDEDKQLSRIINVKNSGYIEENSNTFVGAISTNTVNSILDIINDKSVVNVQTKINTIIDFVINKFESSDMDHFNIQHILYDCIITNNEMKLAHKTNLSRKDLISFIESTQ